MSCPTCENANATIAFLEDELARMARDLIAEREEKTRLRRLVLELRGQKQVVQLFKREGA